MTQHVPEDLLQTFVDGDVGEQVALHIAEHLDACPSCATRAVALEPLAAAFASVRDPVPPEALTKAILARLEEPERLPFAEIAVGAGLLGLASVLMLGLESPISVLVRAGVAIDTTVALARGLATAFGGFELALAVVAGGALLASFVTMRFAVGVPHMAADHMASHSGVVRRST